MRRLSVAFVSAEAAPFAKTGGLGDVAGSLPLALPASQCAVKVFVPYYRMVKKGAFNIRCVKNSVKLDLCGAKGVFSIWHTKRGYVDFYFIRKDAYFDREFIYGGPSGEYKDSAPRFMFFSIAVLQSLVELGVKTDIVHCNDWHTAVIPLLLKKGYLDSKYLRETKTLLTIHNMAFQGVFSKQALSRTKLGRALSSERSLSFQGRLNFLYSGILCADAVNAVSEAYSREILTKRYGCGLHAVVAGRRNVLSGILNGVDYSQWNPKTDRYIRSTYDKDSLHKKVLCKKDLLRRMGLDDGAERPLLGVVSRLAHQKGIDLVASCVPDMVRLGCRLIVLGTGDEKYSRLLKKIARKYPQEVAVALAFDNELAHKIEAGCDIFLMPSRYEPCGLNQIYSLKYGTIPVVRAVGGLDDTIKDYASGRAAANGFRFAGIRKTDLLRTIKRALCVYYDKNKWEQLMRRAMRCDFSWKHSASEYLKLYKALTAK